MTTHKCPRPGCNRQVPYDQYACRADWYALPGDIRTKIWHAWRTGNALAHATATVRALDWYRDNPPRTAAPKPVCCTPDAPCEPSYAFPAPEEGQP